MTDRVLVIQEGPIYPHTSFIAQLAQDAEERVLTEAEAMAITEATMFENLIEDTIPELREQILRLHCAKGCTGVEIEAGKFSGCKCGELEGKLEHKCDCPQHPTLAFENAQVFLQVACNFARGMANDVRRVMERRSLLTHLAALKTP